MDQTSAVCLFKDAVLAAEVNLQQMGCGRMLWMLIWKQGGRNQHDLP